ncbi:FAD:protein FMN transferase [Microbacterium sp. NPDC077184]|uniref:FAD:protein FMN transferase n=1 Tax=Microbacterium sp. NPDC077184 TaxID=3154764 RepID=UPI00343B1A18
MTAARRRPPRHVHAAPVMGSTASIHVIGDLAPVAFADVVRGCMTELRRADRVFSTYRDDSDLRRIARGELAVWDADPLYAKVVAACAAAERDTGGLFRAEFAGEFDPTGLVKGWAVERAARMWLAPLLDEPGRVQAAGLTVGGDMQLFAADGADWTWNVGIVDPADAGRVIATVPVRNGAVATSGTAERGAHIVDPRTGAPATGAASATVIADSLTRADVFATAAVVAGIEDLSWAGRIPEASGVVVSPDGRVRRFLGGIEVQTSPAAA